MTLTMYGIKNCDTIKKARDWLAAHGVVFDFHDYKAKGADAALLADWVAARGWETLLNRKGTTWRKLDPELQAAVVDAATARPVLMAQASVIKRPVVEWDNAITVGFDAADWAGRA